MGRAAPSPNSSRAVVVGYGPAAFPAWIGFVGLVAGVMLLYHQVWSAGFIWDDDAHVPPVRLRTIAGLGRIWFEPGATQQYYPVLYSAFWLEAQLWGDATWGYHLVNLGLHGIAAGLFWQLLRRLALSGAGFAAVAFAFHPVAVESAAWISEQKNTLSTVFYFAAAILYVRFDEQRRARCYALALALFVLALLTKSVTATLPAALLVLFWWQRGRLGWRRDVLPLLPWLLLGIGAGVGTAWVERTHVGAAGAEFALSWTERLLVAGRAWWFYGAKIVWPTNLTFIYPRWEIDPAQLGQYLYPVGVGVVVLGAWLLRRRTRGLLAVVLLFSGTLFPALGFVNVYPFRYSFVADHFQHLAFPIVIAGVAAATAAAMDAWPTSGRLEMRVAAAAGLAGLAVLTWSQSAMYRDSETLWRTTLARNPACWMAANNLGAELLKERRTTEAITLIRTAIGYAPNNASAHTNLGDALRQAGQSSEARASYLRALELEPNNVVALANFGTALLESGEASEAVGPLARAVQLKPDFVLARANLADALLRCGGGEKALLEYERVLAEEPDYREARSNYGIALAQAGRLDAAIVQFQLAAKLDPRVAGTQFNLGNACLQLGRLEEAIAHYRQALELDPSSRPTYQNLATAYQLKGMAAESNEVLARAAAIQTAHTPVPVNRGGSPSP